MGGFGGDIPVMDGWKDDQEGRFNPKLPATLMRSKETVNYFYKHIHINY